jgi:hypothetical protein
MVRRDRCADESPYGLPRRRVNGDKPPACRPVSSPCSCCRVASSQPPHTPPATPCRTAGASIARTESSPLAAQWATAGSSERAPVAATCRLSCSSPESPARQGAARSQVVPPSLSTAPASSPAPRLVVLPLRVDPARAAYARIGRRAEHPDHEQQHRQADHDPASRVVRRVRDPRPELLLVHRGRDWRRCCPRAISALLTASRAFSSSVGGR